MSELCSASEAESIQQQLDIEMNRLFQHFEEDEERTSRLALALEQESTAASLHFALFPRRTRDGGLQVDFSADLAHERIQLYKQGGI
jgi:hypothetical protein